MYYQFSSVQSLSRVRLFATPWTVACQAPLSMGFSRQEYWSGLPFPSPGDLPNPGIEPGSPALEADGLTSEPRYNNYKYICIQSRNTQYIRQMLTSIKRHCNELILCTYNHFIVDPVEAPLVALEKWRVASEWAFSGGTSGKEPTCHAEHLRDTVWPLSMEDLLEKGMATHSTILAWRIPRTEEPGGLQFIGFERVRHNSSN